MDIDEDMLKKVIAEMIVADIMKGEWEEYIFIVFSIGWILGV